MLILDIEVIGNSKNKIIDSNATILFLQSMAKGDFLNQSNGDKKNSLLNNLTMKSKLQSLIFAVSLASIVTVGWLSWLQGRNTLTNKIFQQLTSVRTTKAGEFELYFEILFNQISFLAEDKEIIEAMVNFNRSFRKLENILISPELDQSLDTYYQEEFIPRLSQRLPKGEEVNWTNYRPRNQAGRYLQYYYIADNPNPLGSKGKLIDAGDDSEYTKAHIRYQPKLRKIVQKFGFYDLFLINHKTKDIVYTVFKETDYGTNLETGAYSQSGLAELVDKVVQNPIPGKVKISDFQAYRASYETSVAFIATPIYNGENLLGILVIQIPVDKINDIVSENNDWEGSGLGKTGEDYIIGQDSLMRSVSRFWLQDQEQFKAEVQSQGTSPETIRLMEAVDSNVGLQEIKTPLVQSALGGKKGIDITQNYRGKEVLVSYSPLDIKGLHWAIFSEIETTEAFAPLRRLNITLLIAGVIFLLLSVLIAEFAARLFLKPIHHLINRGKKIQAGELDTEITIDDQGELGELARVFNDVTNNLYQTNQELVAKQQENKFLLQNILPPAIAERKSRGESLIADKLKQVTIVYAHLVGINSLEESMSPEQISALLTELVDEFEIVAESYGIDRHRALGNDYMVVCGLTKAELNQEKKAIDFAQAMLNIMNNKEAEHQSALGLKITIHGGSVTAGIVGTNKFNYNLWGETIDLATQLYPQAPQDLILVTRPVYERVANNYKFSSNPVTTSNFGEVEAWSINNKMIQEAAAKVKPSS